MNGKDNINNNYGLQNNNIENNTSNVLQTTQINQASVNMVTTNQVFTNTNNNINQINQNFDNNANNINQNSNFNVQNNGISNVIQNQTQVMTINRMSNNVNSSNNVYSQIGNNASQNIENSTINNSGNSSYYDNPSNIKKKNPILIIIIFIIVAACGFFVYNKFVNKESNVLKDDIKLNELKKEIVGKWQANYQWGPENGSNHYTINDFTFTFNEDGTCSVNGEFKLQYTDSSGGSIIAVNGTGKYVFNRAGNKLKIEYDDNVSATSKIYSEFVDFKFINDELHIGEGAIYKKISTSNSNSNVNTNNSLVGKWYWYNDDAKNTAIYYLFNEDGTGDYVVNGISVNIKYEIKGNSLFITAGGINEAKENKYEINSNILSIDDGVGVTKFIKE